MWSDRRARAVPALAALLAALCGGALAHEALREPPPRAWFLLSAGLGLGSRAGVAGGFHGLDARLESHRDGAFGPRVGAALDEAFAGALEFEPSAAGARRP